jgi:hypothetical protein
MISTYVKVYNGSICYTMDMRCSLQNDKVCNKNVMNSSGIICNIKGNKLARGEVGILMMERNRTFR